MIVKVKNDFNLLIFNLFNGNAFLTIVILYFLLMRRAVWFENHLVSLQVMHDYMCIGIAPYTDYCTLSSSTRLYLKIAQYITLK